MLPRPGALSTAISPPWASTRAFEIASPSPVPPFCLPASSWLKRWKSLGWSSGGIPTPSSSTSHTRALGSRLRRTVTRPPGGVNLMALFKRLMSTWPRRWESALSSLGALVTSQIRVTLA
ncbi:hypothetical protein D3C86_1860310 [compost metagenome]